MPSRRSLTNLHLQSCFTKKSIDDLARQLEPNKESPVTPYLLNTTITSARCLRMWRSIGSSPHPDIYDQWTQQHISKFHGNIENCIGSIKLPLGIAGPLRVNGLFAKGDYPIPLATNEASLVASYHRGASLLSAAGGCSAMLLYQALNRSPVFIFKSIAEAGRFVAWAMEHFEKLQEITSQSSKYGKLIDVGTTIEGNHVYLDFTFTTGDASGQNMVTIATQYICDFILKNYPREILNTYVEGNLSGDKKASSQAYTSVRGKKVTAEVKLTKDLLEKFLGATANQLVDYWRVSAIGGVLSGTMGVQGHFANGLAALYLATGQDAACVAESAMGVTRFELTEDDGLYASVTIPSIMVGTVGGGTSLPSQKAALDLMGLHGANQATALAEVCASLLLAGELSIIGALATNTFTKAHHKLAR